MRYLTLAEALTIAEAVTGTNVAILAKASRLELLESALHAPQAGFGDVEFYPEFVDKAAVLVVRIAKNHPLPDGNKRLAREYGIVFGSELPDEPEKPLRWPSLPALFRALMQSRR